MKFVYCFTFVLIACAISTTAQSETGTCNSACTDIYQPVCALTPGDGTKTTFASDCELDLQNCVKQQKDLKFVPLVVVSRGECDKLTPQVLNI